jgi:hypothetical protein
LNPGPLKYEAAVLPTWPLQSVVLLLLVYLLILLTHTGIPAVGLDDRAIPKTMDRIICEFTPDERRVLYDFAVSKMKAPPVMKVEELHMP